MDKNELKQSNVGEVAEKTPTERKHAKASQNFKEAIKNNLDKRAQTDELFRTKYETTTRTIDDVITYYDESYVMRSALIEVLSNTILAFYFSVALLIMLSTKLFKPFQQAFIILPFSTGIYRGGS